ncbi:MAG TPA: lytic transglycosylase domain-containing protein [Solirubrobacteraceae bacterium]|nr:lytic transglycosylase domain-containing protein [Solirubrobacteraceae bacterium]
MTPPAASATIDRRSRSRHRTALRRRRLAVALLVPAMAIAGLLSAPLFRRAYADLSLPLAYSSIIRQQAAEKHLDPALVAAVIYAETKFDPRPSSAGAEGLMQILPQTAEFLARRSGATTFTVSDLGTPAVNIAYGSYYLRYLLNQYGGNEVLALAAYNGGETNVDRWLAAAKRAGQPFTVSQIPFPETQAYVLKVLQGQRDYRSAYAKQLGYG